MKIINAELVEVLLEKNPQLDAVTIKQRMLHQPKREYIPTGVISRPFGKRPDRIEAYSWNPAEQAQRPYYRVVR